MKEYTVLIGGHEHTMLLDDEHAKRIGAVEVKPAAQKSVTASNKARTTANK